MEISNELLAAYAKGNVSRSERDNVRQYLTQHPEEMETVLMMMDDDYDLDLHKEAEPQGAMSACRETPFSAKKSFQQRLGDLLDEIELQ